MCLGRLAILAHLEVLVRLEHLECLELPERPERLEFLVILERQLFQLLLVRHQRQCSQQFLENQ